MEVVSPGRTCSIAARSAALRSARCVVARERLGENPIDPVGPASVVFDDLIGNLSHEWLLVLLGRLAAGGGQDGMGRCHNLRAFADCCGDALDRT